MKVHTRAQTVETEGITITDEDELTINMGAHTMMLLSSIYSSTIRGMAREYPINAWDAVLNLSDGADVRPVEIHVPNEFEPYYEVKDYGVGMSPDLVKTIFKVYGNSTKNDNNEETGGLGIGGKIAFAYDGTDQWELRTRWNGREYFFNGHINVRGVPSMPLVADEPTDEPNGVTIRIPMPRKDWDRLKRELRQILPYFPMEYKIAGEDGFQESIPERTYLKEGNRWGLKKGGYNVDSYAVMGGIPYPLDTKELTENTELERRDLQDFALDFDFPVGALDIAPNREQLKYSERTLKGLEKAVQIFHKEIREEAEKEIASAKTEWEALQALDGFTQIKGLKRLLKGAKWKGKVLDPVRGVVVDLRKKKEIDEIYAHKLHQAEQTGLPLDPDTDKKLSEFEESEIVKKYPDVQVEQYANEGKVSVERYLNIDMVTVSPQDTVWVFLNDVSRGFVSRVKHFMQDALTRDRSYSNRRKATGHGKAYLFRNLGDDMTPDTLSKLLGGVPVTAVSTLEHPTKNSDGKTSVSKRVKVKRFTGRTWKATSAWENADIDLADGGFYVSINRYDPEDFSSLISMSNAWDRAKAAGIIETGTPLYGIPRTRSEVENRDNWIDFKEFLDEKLNRLLGANAQAIADYQTWEDSLGDGVVQFLMGLHMRRLPKDSIARVVAESARDIEEKRTKLVGLVNLAHTVGKTIPEKEANEDGNALTERMLDKYPMLRVISKAANGAGHLTLREYEDEVVEYIKSVN